MREQPGRNSQNGVGVVHREAHGLLGGVAGQTTVACVRAEYAVPYLCTGKTMATETTYTQARANLKALLDEVSEGREPVIIHRRGGDDVALIAVDELRSLIETAHLLRSPRNAERLLRALSRAQKGSVRPQSLAKLRRDVGLDD